MIVGVVKETFPGERRVALVPAVVPLLIKAGLKLVIQSGAGEAAGHPDAEYSAKGATIARTREEVFSQSAILCQVRLFSANTRNGQTDLSLMKRDLIAIGLAEPLSELEPLQTMAKTGSHCFALELMPRITRAQAMDVLSSQATVAGYKAIMLAAQHLPRMFPLMMTAAGTIPAAKVFVIGAGVAGLQAIASAKKMGGIVQAYDVRPVVKEQVESLGARFVQIELSSAHAEGQGGYAKEMDEGFYKKQRELLAKVVAQCDVVITTAAIPGAKAPVLITGDMVRSMPHGSVVVDLAAKPGSIGGNCDLTHPDDVFTIPENHATVLGPTNLAATVPTTASQMFAKNVTAFVLNMVKDGQLNVNMSDEIITQTLVTKDGAVINERVLNTFKPKVVLT